MSEETSLDRFLRNRAAVGLGIIDKRLYSIQGLVGGLMAAFGLSMAISPALGASPDVVGGAAGMLAAGAALLSSSFALKRRFHATNTGEWSLSPEAKGLLLKLVRNRNGWFDGGVLPHFGPYGFMGKRTRRRLRHIAWESGEPAFGFGFSFLNRPGRGVSDQVIHLLESAAEQYNRIQGILQSPAPSSALARMAPAAISAADEAMGDVLHDCATLDKFPESAAATRTQIDHGINALRQLATGLEDLATRDQSLTDKVDYTSKIDSVLDELRLEQMARNELQSQPDDIEQRLKGS